jgi:nitrogen regulatory protein PII
VKEANRSELAQVNAIVRTELLDRVIHMLRAAGVPRLTVIPVHAIGQGVDPAAAKLSVREGTEYADKALVQFVCAGDRTGMFTELICRAACTGRQGDGVVYLQPVLEVTKVRTGAEGLSALE